MCTCWRHVPGIVTKAFPFEEWVNETEAVQSFEFDTDGAKKSDLVIYYAPSGKDACAELGAAWASKVPIIGLYAKGEDLGLMRKMVSKWYGRYTEILEAVEEHSLNYEALSAYR